MKNLIVASVVALTLTVGAAKAEELVNPFPAPSGPGVASEWKPADPCKRSFRACAFEPKGDADNDGGVAGDSNDAQDSGGDNALGNPFG